MISRTSVLAGAVLLVMLLSVTGVLSSTWWCQFSGIHDESIPLNSVTGWEDFSVWNFGWRSSENLVYQEFQWSLGVVEKYSTYYSLGPGVYWADEYGNAGSVYYTLETRWPKEAWPSNKDEEYSYYGIKLKGVGTGSKTVYVYGYRAPDNGRSWFNIGSTSFTITVY